MTNKQISAVSTHQALLLDLCHYHQRRTTKPILAVKLQGPKRRYPELDLFRQQIESQWNGLFHLPYNLIKRKVTAYKLIFFALSLFFLTLGILVFYKINFHPFSYNAIYVSHLSLIKPVVCAFCAFLGAASLWMSMTLRTEFEAAHMILRRARYQLRKSYTRKRVEFGLKGLLSYGKSHQKSVMLNQAFYDVSEKIIENSNETYHLFEKIANAPTLNARTREHLYKQALSELSDKLEQLLNIFKSAALADLHSR